MRKASEAEPGKISRALWLTSEYPEEIEADLQRYYGVDYLDHFRGKLGWRKLLVFIDFLPAESAVNTAIRNDMPEWFLAERSAGNDPSQSPWSTAETLLAVLIDEMRTANWMYASAHTDKTIPRPEPLARPGVRARSRRRLSLDEARAIDPRLRTLPDAEAVETFRRLHGY